MTIQERAHQGNDLVGGVFQDVMTGVGETVHFGLWKSSRPFREKILVKNKVLLAPANEHRHLSEAGQAYFNLPYQSVTRVARLEWDVLNKAKDGNAIFPRIVRGEVSMTNLPR